MDVFYFDNNATTKVADKVITAMMPYFGELYGNPSSMHSFGGVVEKKINDARANTASLLGASTDEIIFTSCGTESDSTAIMAAINSCPDKKHLVTSNVEHPAVKNLYEHLAKKGYQTTFIPVNTSGELNLDLLYSSLTDNTALVSIMWANNETGVIFPIDEIAKEVKKRGILFHTDAVQAVGKVPINMKTSNVDMLSLSGHKLHAPKGVGALYIRKGTKFTPFLIGGHQEHGKRGGTENAASIIGLGKACELAAENMEAENSIVKEMRNRLEEGILATVPNVIVNGNKDCRLPNTTNVSFEYIEGESILLMMNEYGICASSGSACTSGSLDPSHVLKAMETVA